MSEPYSDPTFTDDLHELMAVAILAEQRGVDLDTNAIFEAWGHSYPKDALGPIGRGLVLIRSGRTKEGYALVKDAADSAETRKDQAKDVLASLAEDLESVEA